jgi:hypothetical protein
MPGIVVSGTGWEVPMTGTAGEGFGALPFAEVARATVAAQERSLELAQVWAEALRELLASQEEANRALRQSLEAYRDVVERAGATQERTARLVQAALESFTTTTQAQLELARAMLAPLGAAQPEAFGNLVQSWNDAFLRLLEAAPGAQPRRPARGD